MAKPKYLKKKEAEKKEDENNNAAAQGEQNGAASASPQAGNSKNEVVHDEKTSGAMVSFANPVYRQGVSDILVDKIDISYQGNPILENATLNLVAGHRYGLVGPNGCGKSTLLSVLGHHEIPFPSHVDRYYVSHEVAASDMSALEAVLSVDNERKNLDSELEDLLLADQEDAHVIHRMEEIYKRLDELEADTAEARAGKILFGLGFNKEMQKRPTKSFSGGWRMRISLAQALFINPTVLLLDEPTNHLDIEAVVWLENYLSKFSKILFMVSHSQDFMNNVCTKICHMHIKQLQFYDGNYDQFCVTRAEKESNQMKKYQWEQDQIKNMKEYIARFGHGSAKLARQAQSKEKTLARMTRGGLTDAVVRDNLVRFSFPCAGPLPPPMLQFRDISFNYPGRPVLFEHLDLGIDMDSRICLVGPNGAGKTTLTKLMCRELEPTNGYMSKNAHCVMARFHQHFVDQINMNLTPLEWMGQEYPDISEPTVLRSALGKFGISGKAQMTPMNTLSDGQKSRVVLSWMAFRKPHFMILDEPTNHLDIESIDALAEAINEFEGAVVVVSHDLRLIAQIADEIWIVDEGKAQRFNGDIADYKEHVQKQVEAMMQSYN